MNIRLRRNLRIAAAAIAGLALVGAVLFIGRQSKPAYCKRIVAIIDYTQTQTGSLNSWIWYRTPPIDSGRQEWRDQFVEWAMHIQDYATHEQDYARQDEEERDKHNDVPEAAQQLADNSLRLVNLFLGLSNRPPPEQNPDWIDQYNDIREEFDLYMDVLNNACPK